MAAFINSFKLLTTKQMALLCVPFAYTGKKMFSRLRTSAEFLPSAIEVCEGYVFTPVCHSVHRWGVQAKAQGGLLGGGCPGPGPVGGCPGPGPVGGCPGPGPGGCVLQHALRQTPPPPQQTATAADGTYPTGMHSCFKLHVHPLIIVIIIFQL